MDIYEEYKVLALFPRMPTLNITWRILYLSIIVMDNLNAQFVGALVE